MLRTAILSALALSACAPSAGPTSAASGAGSTGETTAATSTGATPTSSGAATGTDGEATGDAGTGGAATTGGSTGASTEAGATAATTGGIDDGPRYDEVRQKSSHNSFQRDEALFDQLVYHRARSLEFDVHVGKSFAPELVGDWYVYHIDVIDAGSACRTLSQCLEQVAAFARAAPEHEVVTLWIDLKDGFDGEHRPEDLDARLLAAFGERLWTPGALLAGCPGATSLQAAATLPGCDWPTLAALRGRVVVALTGGGLDDPSGALATYVGADAAARAAFVAPDLGDAAAIGDHGEAVFFNLAAADVAIGAAVRAAGLVSRVWVLDDAGPWGEGVAAGVHHLASNKVDAVDDPWASTASAAGWPFTCIEACEAPTQESAAIVAVDVDSGDLWGGSDDGVFAHLPVAAGDVTLTAAIAVKSGDVEPWAKTCLGARAGVAADAPYLAICRPADAHPPAVQLRATAGGSVETFDFAGVDGLSEESPAFVRLVRTGACVRGLASADGVMWSLLAEHCFAAAPSHVGVLASSHGAGPLRALVVDPRANPGGAIAAGDLTVVSLGGGVGAVQDGLAP